MIPTTSEYGLGVRSLFSIGIVGCFALESVGLAQLVSGIDLTTLMPLIAGLCLGVLLADLLTATVHWACDTWGSEQTPWVGGNLIRGFRDHHRDPSSMLDHDWISVNGEPATAGFVALIGFGLLPPDFLSSHVAIAGPGTQVFASALFLSLIGVSAFTNQLHYWAHAVHPPGFIKRLQRAGLILSRVEHAEHHRSPHMHGYCISTGWLNRPLDAIQFWRRIESCLTAISGVEPRQDVDRIG